MGSSRSREIRAFAAQAITIDETKRVRKGHILEGYRCCVDEVWDLIEKRFLIIDVNKMAETHNLDVKRRLRYHLSKFLFHIDASISPVRLHSGLIQPQRNPKGSMIASHRYLEATLYPAPTSRTRRLRTRVPGKLPCTASDGRCRQGRASEHRQSRR